MPASRHHLRLYGASEGSTAAEPSDQERTRWAMLATRLAHWLSHHKLLSPRQSTDDYTELEDSPEEVITFSINELAILDTPGASRTVGYSTVRIGNEVYLTRDGRIFCLAAKEPELKIRYNAPIANADDYVGLQRALPVLIEVAKYPAHEIRARAQTAMRENAGLHQSTIPSVDMDKIVLQHIRDLLSPLAQLFKRKMDDVGQVPQSIDVTRTAGISPDEVALDVLSRRFERVMADTKALARFTQTTRGLSVVRSPDLEKKRVLALTKSVRQ